MKFVTDVEKNKFESFVSQNIYKSHFLQSYKWGEFAKVAKNLIPHYVALLGDNEEIQVATLLLEKKLPLGYSYFYAPRGFVMDMYDKNLLTEFTKEIKKFSKKHKGIFVKIDPDIIISIQNNAGDTLPLEKDGMKVYDNLKSLGYKHLGFTKNFETSQPRYSFRIDLNKDFEEINNAFSKTTKQRIKRAVDYEVEVKIGKKEDLKEFFKLMAITENRKNFVTHELDYYEKLYDIFSKEGLCNLFLGIVNLSKIIEKLEFNLNETILELTPLMEENLSKNQKTKKSELEKRRLKLEEDIAKYKKYKGEYGDEITLNGHFIIEYGNKAWVLYAGNHNILSETGSNYLVYREHIRYYHEKGTQIYDQFGTIGNFENKELLGLHEFKKKFGGDYVEFVGEFDLVTNKLMYFVFTKLVPLYRNIIKKRAKKRRKKNEV